MLVVGVKTVVVREVGVFFNNSPNISNNIFSKCVENENMVVKYLPLIVMTFLMCNITYWYNTYYSLEENQRYIIEENTVV